MRSTWLGRLGLALVTGMLIAIPGALVLARHIAPDRDSIAITFPSGENATMDWNRLRHHSTALSVTLATLATPSPAAAPILAQPAPLRPAPPGPTPPPAVSAQQALINQDRARNGLSALAWSPCLAAIALQNAQRMAAQGYISHTNGPTLDLGCGLGNHAAENVGYTSGGINDALLNNLFMNSPDHRANILGPYYHYVGTAWAVAPNGYAYIAVEFS